MKFLCWFMQCHWIRHFNVKAHRLPQNYKNYANPDGITYEHPVGSEYLTGIYQCSRCKRISIGSPG